MKNQERLTYLALGVLITIIVLALMGRLRIEKYEEASEEELMQFLEEVEGAEDIEESEMPMDDAMGPAPMGEEMDSDEEED